MRGHDTPQARGGEILRFGGRTDRLAPSRGYCRRSMQESRQNRPYVVLTGALGPTYPKGTMGLTSDPGASERGSTGKPLPSQADPFQGSRTLRQAPPWSRAIRPA